MTAHSGIIHAQACSIRLIEVGKNNSLVLDDHVVSEQILSALTWVVGAVVSVPCKEGVSNNVFSLFVFPSVLSAHIPKLNSLSISNFFKPSKIVKYEMFSLCYQTT